MKLSIIIPTYNSASVLSGALDSIVCQTFTDWEVLVMDGASTDDTLKVAQSYNDIRIRIYSEPDKGIYDAMNKGIKKAQGEWLYFLGSDDYLLTQNTLKELFSNNISCFEVIYGEVCSPILSEDNRGEWTMKNISANRCHQSIFYKKCIFTKLGLYNLRYPYAADFEFNLRWFFDKKIRKKYIPLEIAYFSPGGASECNSDDFFWKDYYMLVLKNGYRQLKTSEKVYYVQNALLQDISHIEHAILFCSLKLLRLKIIIRRKIKQLLYGSASC